MMLILASGPIAVKTFRFLIIAKTLKSLLVAVKIKDDTIFSSHKKAFSNQHMERTSETVHLILNVFNDFSLCYAENYDKTAEIFAILYIVF